MTKEDLRQPTPTNAPGKIDKTFLVYADDALPIRIDFDDSPIMRQLHEDIRRQIDGAKSGTEALEILKGTIRERFGIGPGNKYGRASLSRTLIPTCLDDLFACRATCLHTSLIGAIILDKLTEDGYLKGKPVLGFLPGDRSSHWWIEVANGEDEHLALDVVNDFVGTKADFEKIVLSDMADEMFY